MAFVGILILTALGVTVFKYERRLDASMRAGGRKIMESAKTVRSAVARMAEARSQRMVLRIPAPAPPPPPPRSVPLLQAPWQWAIGATGYQGSTGIPGSQGNTGVPQGITGLYYDVTVGWTGVGFDNRVLNGDEDDQTKIAKGNSLSRYDMIKMDLLPDRPVPPAGELVQE